MPFPETNRRWMFAATAIVMAVVWTGTAAAQSMVVRSTGPSASKYPTGTKFKPTDRLSLVAGDRVVLLQSGKTRTLSGPGTFGASGTVQASQTLNSTVSRMIARSPGRPRGGFSRGADEPVLADVRAPSLWLLDYRKGGNFCVLDPATLLLWRPDMGTDTLLKIETGEGASAKSDTVALVSGANFRKWPTESIPIQYGVEYRLSGAGLATPVQLRFTKIDALPETAEESVNILVSKDCGSQLDRLVDTMAEADGAPG
jgi:hypothetical protein